MLISGGVPAQRIRIVHSGVDPNRFSYDIPPERMREELGIPPQAPVIGNIASLVDHKGHRYLLEAMPAILERHPDAQLVLVGDGPLADALHRQAEQLGIASHVHFTGFRKDVETFLSGFDLFALSSHLERPCTSLIDAMFHRVPVVATDTGGVPDLVRNNDTGLLAPPRFGEALAEAILQMLGDAERRRHMAENACVHAMEGFTAEAMVWRTIEAYSERP